MPDSEERTRQILAALQERAKELNCLYAVDEILSIRGLSMAEMAPRIIATIPQGWQYSAICQARLEVRGAVFRPEGFVETEWRQLADIVVEGERAGQIAVFYTEARPDADEGPFLKEERRLINAIAERIAFFLLQQKLRSTLQSWNDARAISTQEHPDWKVILNFIRKTDPRLLERITRKMINHLCGTGTQEADVLLQEFLMESPPAESVDENRPQERRALAALTKITEKAFDLAAGSWPEDELVQCLETWIEEEKASFLFDTLENPHSSLQAIADAIQRFQSANVDESKLSRSVQTSLRAALLRRVFSDNPSFVNVAKDHFALSDFYDIFPRVVHSSESHGKLGGKSAGLFLAAQVARRAPEGSRSLRESQGAADVVRRAPTASWSSFTTTTSRTSTTASTRRSSRSAQEYPHIVQVFKNSRFPPEIVQGALGRPRRLRRQAPSSCAARACSRTASGTAFSGKYKSLFLANQGTKTERLDALQDAIAEVYASIFGPDPIEYRARARPARLPRGDGDPDPGGGGHARRQVLPARLRRRGASATTSSAGRRASSARTGWCAWCRGWARARSTA